VWIALDGGISHVDSFDPKRTSPFRAISSKTPGLELCEFLPRLAERSDRLTFIRGMSGQLRDHQLARYAIETGFEPELGTTHRHVGAVGDRMAVIGGLLPAGIECRAARTASCADESKAGEVLAALRSGETFIRVQLGDWDDHVAIEERLPAKLRQLDRSLAELLDGLRDVWDSTLVVIGSEFGRSPTMNATGGRDHHSDAWTVALGGGPISGGRVVGATDPDGAFAIDGKVQIADLRAICSLALGLDHAASGALSSIITNV